MRNNTYFHAEGRDLSDKRENSWSPANGEFDLEEVVTEYAFPDLADLQNDKGAPISRKKVEKSLRLGKKAALRHDWAEAVKHLTFAWEALPQDVHLLTILGHCLVQLGVRKQAIEIFELALKEHEPTPDIIAILLQLSLEMEMPTIAIKLGHHLLSMKVSRKDVFQNMASAYNAAGLYDEGIELLQSILPMFPEEAGLWNVLAIMVRNRDGVDAADVFFEEALKHDPDNYQVLSNYALSFGERLDFEKVLELDMRAIAAYPQSPEPHLGAANILFLKGKMKEAWEHYDYRFDKRRKSTQTQHYTHGLPVWDGSDLSDQTLLVAAEQGIGDEVMFGNYLPFLYEQAKRLAIGCDHRLVSIYQRRFPDAVVSAFRDVVTHGYRYRTFPDIEKQMKDGTLKIDCAMPVASVAKYAWTSLDKIAPHPEGFLRACPERAAEIKERLASFGAKPKIGLAWRSGRLTDERKRYYASMQDMGSLLSLHDKVDFINLQYDDCADELKYAKETFGAEVIAFDDIDLKKDIEANLAIMENCDLVVSAIVAPCNFAMALGRPTVVMGVSPPWWSFGHESKIPFVPDAEYVWGRDAFDWDAITCETKSLVVEKLGL